ncbi:hypothetical protein Tco_1493978 [Tanacetum coccineum]
MDQWTGKDEATDKVKESLRKTDGRVQGHRSSHSDLGDSKLGALHSPRRELHNELKYVQNGVNMNEISCLKVRHVEYKIWKAKPPTSPKKGSGEWMTNNTPPVTVTPPVNTIGASVTNTVGNHVEKTRRRGKFNGLILRGGITQDVQAVEAGNYSGFLVYTTIVLNGLVDFYVYVVL